MLFELDRDAAEAGGAQLTPQTQPSRRPGCQWSDTVNSHMRMLLKQLRHVLEVAGEEDGRPLDRSFRGDQRVDRHAATGGFAEEAAGLPGRSFGDWRHFADRLDNLIHGRVLGAPPRRLRDDDGGNHDEIALIQCPLKVCAGRGISPCQSHDRSTVEDQSGQSAACTRRWTAGGMEPASALMSSSSRRSLTACNCCRTALLTKDERPRAPATWRSSSAT